jgi:hypothetical protein
MMTSNEDKSIEECLQLLIKQLRHLQHGLNSELRSEKFIHNKLINACQNVFACQYACFKLSDSLVDLINDLRSSIIIYQKVNSVTVPCQPPDQVTTTKGRVLSTKEVSKRS